ncbi:MAG: hypothetical protein O3A14_01585 [Cyanobacteria bacterium]|nr:hypothetical protein [Cyanobacteriota bacterium]
MDIRWRSAFRYPQTQFLLTGTGLGYLALVVFTGFAVAGILAGGAIALAMLAIWFLQFRRDRLPITSNLLEPEVMLERLDGIAARTLPGVQPDEWIQAYRWATASQQAAAQIAERDALLVPDLMETLYTVEGLAAQVASSVAARKQVQTEQYRHLTQQYLQESSDRLQATHDQLQQLRDQIVLAQLTSDGAADTSLPDRLQLLIDANKTTLKASNHDRA